MKTLSPRKAFGSRSQEGTMQGNFPCFFCLCLLIVAAVALVPKSISSAHFSNNVRSAAAPEAAKSRLVESYGKLPLSFELNRGQTEPQVKFLSRGNGYTLFLEPTEAVLNLKKHGTGHTRPEKSRRGFFRHAANHQLRQTESGSGESGSLLRMKLVGANPEPHVTGIDELPGKSNYFAGNDPDKWRTNVPTYGKVKYQNVYPGVDLIYYGNQRQLEYDFVVAPGADPKAIRLGLEGADKAEIDAHGNLVLETGAERDQIRLHKPLVYQEANGARQEIPGGFVLQDKHQVSFYLAAYDAAKPLIIDPVLVYSTYLGGGADDEIDAIAVDASGNAYVSGSTSSTDFPGTANSVQPAKRAGQPADVRDAFIAKLNPEGTALVWATYVGGSLGDDTSGIVVSSAGNVYVTGNTSSTDFPTTNGAFQRTTQLRNCGTGANQSACSGMFVLQLNPTGTTLVYSSYLGGTDDEVHALAVDSSGNAYVTGLTSADTFPTTPGAFQTKFAPDTAETSFVTKLNPTGTALVYSTFLGGGSDQNGNDIAVDSAGNAYVTGFTDSTDFPTTSGAFRTALAAGNCGTAASPNACPDAFVTKLNSAGTALVYSTYLGGGGEDAGFAIAIDSSGAAYVTGSTNSSNFPVLNPIQNAFAGGKCGSGASATTCSNAFIAKLNPTGSALVYSTYLGGDGSFVADSTGDAGAGIAVDSMGNAYVVGDSGSSNFPTLSPLDDVSGCPCPNFVAKLSPAGALLYSTPLGSDTDIRRIVVDSSGSVYITGEADSEDFPTTDGAFQTSLKGDSDGYITKLADEAAP
jgi:hypothetical protein